MWGSKSHPRDRESRALLTEPTRRPIVCTNFCTWYVHYMGVQLHYFVFGHTTVPVSFVAQTVLPPLKERSGTLVSKIDCTWQDLFLDSHFYSILICISLLMQVPHSLDSVAFHKFWNCEGLIFKLFFFKIVWLSWVPCISTWLLPPACQFLPRSQPRLRYGSRWICRSICRSLS